MAEDQAENTIGYSFKIDHSSDDESFQCWEGLSLFLILTGTALDRGLVDELNKVKRRVWYIDADDDNKEKEIDIGIFDIAVTWLRGHMKAEQDLFDGYLPEKLTRTPEDEDK